VECLVLENLARLDTEGVGQLANGGHMRLDVKMPQLRSGAGRFPFPPRPIGKGKRRGGESVEKMEIRKKKAEGLDMQELEAHSRAELLPDRIEMHRRSVRKKTVRKWNCSGTCIKSIG
jgi:hypothetical protein